MYTLRRKTAFTLVEIMIVVAIIGLLAAIAIPSFLKARLETQRNVCVNNLRLIDWGKEQWAFATFAQPTAMPEWSDLGGYVKGGTAQCTCPWDQSGTPQTSYSMNDLTTLPTCKLAGTQHVYRK